MHAWCLQRPEEAIGSPETEVTDGEGCAIKGALGLKPSPLEEQPMLLSTEPSLQPLNLAFYVTFEWHFIEYSLVGKHLQLTGL